MKKLYINTLLLSFLGYNSLQAQSNECAGATTLTSATSCTTTAGNTSAGFTASGVGCGTGDEDDDGWYQFVAVASVQVITVDGAVGFDPVLACYTSCAATTSPTGGTCVDATNDGGIETLNLSGLTIGSTYFIKTHDYAVGGGSFTICVTGTPPPPEDECAGAISLTPSATPACSATNGSSTTGFSASAVGCLTGNEDDDIWYKFVASANSHKIAVDGVVGFDAVVACYTSCAATASPAGGACTDASGDGSIENLTLTGLSVGTTYYVKLHDFGAGGGDFTICVTTPLANDECVNATTMTPGTPITASTQYADQDYTWVGQPCTNTGEVWYKFTTPATANCYSLAYDQIVNGCNTVSIWENACPEGAYTDYQANFSTNNFNDQGSNESELAGMLPNTTYYISISNDIDANFTFNIRPNTPLASNDQCSGAAAIGTSPQAADNAVAGCEYSFVSGQDGGIQATDPSNCDRTQDFPCSTATGFGPLSICALTLENISWYQFTAAANGTVTISFSGIECNNGGGGFQSGLFTGATCGTLSATGACVAAASGTATYTIPSAVAGASYYIAMDGNAGSNCHYQVSGVNVTPLPIELGMFKAVAENNTVKLNWNTFSERNNNYFTIEKSRNGTDFEFVGKVKGAGNSTVEQFYSLVDNTPYEGTTYYKLSQTDFDGTTTESSFADVFIKRSENLEIQVFPNPSAQNTNAFVSIYNQNIEDITIEIFEIDGKMIDTKTIRTQEFNTKLEMKHAFKAGVYIVKAKNNSGEVDTFKWIIE